MRSDLRVVALSLVVAALAGGCRLPRTVLDDSAVDRFGTADAELDFWDDLAVRHVVTNHDALHALLLTADGAAPTSYDAHIAEARQRGWLDDDAAPSGNESASVGMISVAVCDLVGLDGGLAMRVLGPSPRVCVKEIVYLGLLPPRTTNQALSGLEFIDLLTRVETLQADRQGGKG